MSVPSGASPSLAQPTFLGRLIRLRGAPGRLDKQVFIGPPDIEARQEALRLFMKDRPQGEIKWFEIAERSEDYSFAELKFVVDEAARTALADRRPISSDDLSAVIDDHPPQPKMTAEEYQ